MGDKPKITGKITTQLLPPDFFSIFKKGARLEANKLTEKLAKEIAEEAKDIIRNQKYELAPLSPAYEKHKEKKNLDPRIFVATRDYLDHGIGHWKKGKFNFVGPLPKKRRNGKLKHTDVARWLEFGTFNEDGSVKMPARPMWRALKSSVKRRSKILKQAYAKAMRAQMKAALKTKVKSKKRDL